MRFGLQVYSAWSGGPEAIGATLARVVRSADDAGFDSIWVTDHSLQIGAPGSETEPMLEGWTADELVDRFGRLGDVGVQQVIINTADFHNPDAMELLAIEVMPESRG